MFRFGCVYKARWRGTDVAVKMLPSHNPSKDMFNNFKDEVLLSRFFFLQFIIINIIFSIKLSIIRMISYIYIYINRST